jgi:peptidoglycan/LPS O-acetylase OafA/YrhL
MNSIRSNTTSSSEKGRIPALDGLRGTAILLVVVWHYFYFYPDPNHHPANLLRKIYVYFERCIAVGWSGVDLFFVLSGFLIGGILLDVRTSHSYFKTFYLRRFFRIIPVYYAWIGIYLLLLLGFVFARHQDSLGEPKFWYEISAQFVFFQNLGIIHYSGLGVAWFASTWSLAVEEQFYLVAPLTVRWLSSRALRRLLVCVVVVTPFVRLLVYYHFPATVSLDPAYILMPCRADGLALGMLVAFLWREPQSHNWLHAHRRIIWCSFCAFLAGVAGLGMYSPSHHSITMQSVGFTWIAIFFAHLLVLALVSPSGVIASVAKTRWLCELGNVSYCLYIIHQAVNSLCHSILQPTAVKQLDWRAIGVPMVACVFAYSIAKLSLVYFERPMLRIGHTFKY